MKHEFGEPPSQFHLSQRGKESAEILVKAHWFDSQPSAARFAFAVSLRNDIPLDEFAERSEYGSAHGGSTHSLSAVDPNYEMDSVLRVLRPEHSEASRKEVYSIITRLSDVGLSHLAQAVERGAKITDFID